MYSPKLLESTFVEIHNENKSNVVVGTIYRHHAFLPSNFSNNFLTPLLEKITKQGKFLVLLRDFNLNILNNTDSHISEFIDIISSYLMLLHINLPTRISKSSQTLIDNISLLFKISVK